MKRAEVRGRMARTLCGSQQCAGPTTHGRRWLADVSRRLEPAIPGRPDRYRQLRVTLPYATRSRLPFQRRDCGGGGRADLTGAKAGKFCPGINPGDAPPGSDCAGQPRICRGRPGQRKLIDQRPRWATASSVGWRARARGCTASRGSSRSLAARCRARASGVDNLRGRTCVRPCSSRK